MTAGGPPAQHWCIITPEYPPLPGGIGDHSWLLAQALTAAGDTVEVWIPPGPRAPALPGVTVHVLPSEYGLDALRVLRDALRALPADARVLVQYAPTAFGMRRLNVPFAALLFLHARRGISFDLYFHGGGYPIRFRQAPRRTIAALLHRLMTWLVVRGARRVFVAIPEWQRHLRRLGIRQSDRDRVVTWSPVPSNVPDRADRERVAAIRASLGGGPPGGTIGGQPGSTIGSQSGSTIGSQPGSTIVGHFGRYGPFHQRILPRIIERLLDARRTRTMLLVGFGSGAVRDAVAVARPDLAARIVATGHVDAAEVSAHLAACDVLLQPYEEGASTSHSSLIAGLALGRAVVSNIGPDTGAVWTTRRSLWLTKSYDADDLVRAVGTLLDDAPLRESLGAEGRALYQELFAMARGVTRLRNTSLAPAVEDEIALPAEEPPVVEPSEPEEPAEEGSPRVLMVLAAPFDTEHPLRRAAHAVHHLANTLVELGASVTVASIGAPPPDAAYAYRALPSRGIARLVAPLAAGRISDARFDVVHHHGGAFIRRGVRPVVRTLHASPLLATTFAARIGRAASRFVDRVSLRRADAVVSTGAGVDRTAGRTILGGVDVERVRPARAATSAPRILFIGDLLGERRGRWLYDLYREHIVPRRPDVELHLIADVAPPSHPGMHFEALATYPDLAAAYAEASVFAAPSTLAHADAALLEAMAAGVPVIATPAPGATELLGNGRFGILADDAVFADAILRLLDDETMHGRLAAAARTRAEELSWRRVAEQYLTLYVSLMIGVRDDGGTAPVGAARQPRHVERALAELLAGAVSLIDVGAGSGEATLRALADDGVRQLLAVETREEYRQSLRRALAAEGYALDPRLELRAEAIASHSDDGAMTLDDHAARMESPLLVRVADPAALEAVMAGATLTLDRHATRWLVAVPDTLGEQYEITFRVKGYDVRHLRTRTQHWIAAVRR